MSAKNVNALLRGGPAAQLTDHDRIRHVGDADHSVKILRGNRYEHFEPTSEFTRHQGRRLRVFVWTHHTFVAE